MKKINFLTLILGLFIAGCQQQQSLHLRKEVIKKIYPGIVEVVVPKQEDDDIVYQRPLPWDQLDYMERNDDYHAIGTAFFINKKRLISAAHVFSADQFSLYENYFIRTNKGEVFPLKNIYRYSSYRDIIEFDLEKYPEFVRPLSLSPSVEIGDMVYAVGNAQGQGISTRGGQVSTFTPEPVAGEWDYIRFSSPASPGNSGGPLVNSKGQVVGVVVMKNNSENLNFALPVAQIDKASTEKAHFFERQLKVQDGMQTLVKDWSFFTPLPSTYSALNALAAPSKNKFYKNLIIEFKKKFHDLIFPYNVRFRDALLYQRLYPRFSIVEKDRALHDWQIKAIELNKIVVSEKNILYQGKGEVFHMNILFKATNEQPTPFLFNSPRLLLNRFLIATGANRYMAGQNIPIIDHGEPDETMVWRDRLGRPWRTSHWMSKYNNMLITSHCSPTPEGVYCFLDHSFAGRKLEGYMAFVRENILEINISYRGTPDQWVSYMAMDKENLPTILHNVKVKKIDKKIRVDQPELTFTTGTLKKSSLVRLTALINYDPSQILASQIQGWELLLNKNRPRGMTIYKNYEVQKLAPDQEIERWHEIKNQTGRYNGRIHEKNNRLIMREPLGPMREIPFQRGSETKNIQEQWWKSCYAPNTTSQRQLKNQCEKAPIKLRSP